MWVALLVSHLAGYLLIHALYVPGGIANASAPVTAAPGLPPTPGVPDLRGRTHLQDANRREQGHTEADTGEGLVTNALAQSIGLPLQGLLLDYGVRIAIIALAAWWAARWLAQPMRSLVAASRSLSTAILRGAPPCLIDEQYGTWEVREAAHVFNSMASRLQDQFRARGLMVAAMSHDLRTPLTRLRMRLDAMDDPDTSVLLERCIRDIREMDKLIDTVLGVFRGDALGTPEVLQETALVALLQSLTDDMAEQGQPVGLLIPSFRAGTDIALVEPAALRRVVGNLIDNALRYAGAAEVSIELSAQQIRIVVEDRGPGIPQEHLQTVFEPFFRVDPSRSRGTGGTGLGLFIARELALRQSAQISLASREGGGLRAEVLISL
ncbi:HAMP domain-containing sensor histidine kinase [Acidovorax sp. LjRoot194]